MKKTSILFTVIALVLSHVMCAVVAFAYRGVICDIEHAGFSAPAEIAFIYAVPFLVGIIICSILAVVFMKKK